MMPSKNRIISGLTKLLRGLSISVVVTLIFGGYVSAAPQAQKSKAAASSAEQAGDPEAQALNTRGVELLQNADFSGAIEQFKRALAREPRNLTVVANLSGAYIAAKNFDQAIDLLTTYNSQYGKDPQLFGRLGDAYFSSKRPQESIAPYEQALKLDPTNVRIADKLSTVYAMQNRLADAERVLVKAIESDPKNGLLLTNLSNVFLANSKPGEAIRTAKLALQVQPSSDVYVTMGSAYEQLKDLKNSLIAYQRAFDLGDQRPEIKSKLDDLKGRIG